ncbi:hypothetical protein BDY24DRAFT_227070 [Mrakia frigida]|uniref:uncharacterized protein n=1 Tax=Mrakia frigida TaxID=29902 RepID=UPI003FCC11A2
MGWGLGFGGRKVVVGMVKGSTLDSWDIQRAMEVQAFTSSPLSSHPAIQAQRTGSSAGNSFLSPSILLPQVTGNGNGNWNGNGTSGEDEHEDDGIAREKKGQKEAMPMERDLVKNLLRTFQLSSLEVVAFPSSPSIPPNEPLTASTGPGTFSTLKLSSSPLTDLTSVSTLGTRQTNSSPLANNNSKPSLQSMFDDPSKPVESLKKTVRISEKVPSIIAAFAPGSMAGSEGSGSEEEEGWDGEGEDGGLGEEEMLRRMEEVGLEVVMVYEEEPEAEVEGGGEGEKVGVAV